MGVSKLLMAIVQLDFRTDDAKLNELCRKYWDVSSDLKFAYKTTDLAQEYGIKPSRLSATLAENCIATAIGDVCAKCGRSYHYSTRTDFVDRHRYSLPKWVCDECMKKEDERKAAEQAAHEAKQRDRLLARFTNQKRGPLDPRSIEFDDAVYLLSFFRLGATEDLRFIRSLSTFKEGSLSPSAAFDLEIIRQLYDHKLLFVHPDSPIEAFDDNLTTYYPTVTYWWTPMLSLDKPANAFFIELETLFRNMDWSDHWNNQIYLLWKRIAVEECLQYLTFTLGEHSLELKHGPKTLHVLNNVLESYSVSQVFNFIWRAAKDAAAFYLRERVPKQHAANTVVGSIQRQADKAKSEGWNVKGYQRNYKVPQSTVSRVFADTVMQFGDEGFTSPPRTGNTQAEVGSESQLNDD